MCLNLQQIKNKTWKTGLLQILTLIKSKVIRYVQKMVWDQEFQKRNEKKVKLLSYANQLTCVKNILETRAEIINSHTAICLVKHVRKPSL